MRRERKRGTLPLAAMLPGITRTSLPWLGALLLLSSGAARADDEAIARGLYIAGLARCVSCHTDSAHGGPTLAGGRELKTSFGTFYSPNISPDPRDGIGGWSDADFVKAMRRGVSPSGYNYYPICPYPDFTLMSERDLLDLRAYLATLPAVPQPNRDHALDFPYSVRMFLTPWKILYFRRGPMEPDLTRTIEWNRGAYLVRAVGHCVECHTPRNAVGAIRKKQRMGGVATAADGAPAPDISPHPAALASWSADDFAAFFKDGVTPNGDQMHPPMTETLQGTARLSDQDRHAMGVYLKSIPPVPPPNER